ncbi:hypothetical protein [Saccharolobus islandicus]|uniref:Uncharacterized protein n=1 Tax=Saccharolobus islandicus (strain M.16.4 / Kamchatka \|nr:hypothetical protein [Sulfolobus islandicus]ACR41621.1 hypothetical protein M164_1014 [Sulfolobus islandicus M.16.4]
MGRSIDELTEGYEDDVIFLGIRLDLENWKDISVSLFKAYNVDLNALYGLVDNYLKDLIRKSSEYLLDFTRKENLITSINTISECYNQVNYPALTDGASPPHDGDFLLLRATSIPLHPQWRFHRTEPFCNAPCGRGVTEGLLSTGLSSPSP